MLTTEFSGLDFEESKVEWLTFREHLATGMKDFTFHQTLEEVATKMPHLFNLHKLAMVALTLPVSTAGKDITYEH